MTVQASLIIEVRCHMAPFSRSLTITFAALPLPGFEVHHNEYKGSCWSQHKDHQQMTSFDDETVARQKGEWIAKEGLGGAMFWDLSSDKGNEEGRDQIESNHDHYPGPGRMRVDGPSLVTTVTNVIGDREYSENCSITRAVNSLAWLMAWWDRSGTKAVEINTATMTSSGVRFVKVQPRVVVILHALSNIYRLMECTAARCTCRRLRRARVLNQVLNKYILRTSILESLPAHRYELASFAQSCTLLRS